jgi:hypothetical protein
LQAERTEKDMDIPPHPPNISDLTYNKEKVFLKGFSHKTI